MYYNNHRLAALAEVDKRFSKVCRTLSLGRSSRHCSSRPPKVFDSFQRTPFSTSPIPTPPFARAAHTGFASCTMPGRESNNMGMPYAIPDRTSSVAAVVANNAKADELEKRRIRNEASRQVLKRKRSGPAHGLLYRRVQTSRRRT
jgi:hypothetical protein